MYRDYDQYTDSLLRVSKTIETKQVSVEFDGGGSVKGVKFKQLDRKTKKAIYERSDGYYEVIIIGIKEAETIFGTEYPRREAYPSNEDFGELGCVFAVSKMPRRNMMNYRSTCLEISIFRVGVLRNYPRSICSGALTSLGNRSLIICKYLNIPT